MHLRIWTCSESSYKLHFFSLTLIASYDNQRETQPSLLCTAGLWLFISRLWCKDDSKRLAQSVIICVQKADDPVSPATQGTKARLCESLHLGSKGGSSFSPPCRWLGRGAVSVSHSAVLARSLPGAECFVQHNSCICCWGLDKQTQSWATGQQLFVHTASLVSNADGTAHLLYQFYSGEPTFPSTAANKSEPEICLGRLLQDLAPWQCLQQTCLCSITDGTANMHSNWGGAGRWCQVVWNVMGFCLGKKKTKPTKTNQPTTKLSERLASTELRHTIKRKKRVTALLAWVITEAKHIIHNKLFIQLECCLYCF